MSKGFTSLGSLPQLRPGVRTRRFSSYDTAGGNADNWPIAAGESVTIAEMEGAGCVKHIWMTTREPGNNLRRLVLKFYWDGEETPSVLCPIGDFFGLGHAKANYFSSAPLQVSYLAMNSYFAMPFSTGARMVVENDSDEDSFLYFYVDYESWPEAKPDLGRFHANWRRQLVVKKDAPIGPNARGHDQRLNTTGDDNYLLLDTQGRGHYVGSVLHIDTNETGWWGEGDDMFFIDGEDWPPRLHGTGTEDYFCGAWNYNQLREPYSTPYLRLPFQWQPGLHGQTFAVSIPRGGSCLLREQPVVLH